MQICTHNYIIHETRTFGNHNPITVWVLLKKFNEPVEYFTNSQQIFLK